jgi:hypothetical protein
MRLRLIVISALAFLSFPAYSQDAIPSKRAHHELIYDPVNKVVLMMNGSTPLNGGSSFQFYNDVWKYDGKAWTKIGNAGDERSGIKLAFDTKRHLLFSFGGFLSNNSCSGEMWEWFDGYWSMVTNEAGMKAAEPGFVYDSDRDRLIVFGGSAAQRSVNNTTWEWDGTFWTKFDGPGPEGRQGHVMIYDSKRKKTVLYGGMNGSGKQFDDGIWEFDGTQWLNIPNPKTNPGPRLASGYTYDSKRGLLILFGGMSNDVTMGDTWSWEGRVWKKLSDKGPAPRMMGYMAYDANRDRIVLFGGRLGWPNDVNDTWEWDGSKWQSK